MNNQSDSCHIHRLSNFATIGLFRWLALNTEPTIRSWDMVTPIEAIRGGMGFDAAGRWHEARTIRWAAGRWNSSENEGSPARGAVLGVVLGGLLWVGLIAGVRALLHLL